jgi:hypothetical protein
VLHLKNKQQENTKKMAIYNKSIELNGKSTKAKVGFAEYSNTITTSDIFKETYSTPMNVWIDDVCFENAITAICNLSKKTGRHTVSYICNKTGIKFPDSEKKVVEHILNMQN